MSLSLGNVWLSPKLNMLELENNFSAAIPAVAYTHASLGLNEFHNASDHARARTGTTLFVHYMGILLPKPVLEVTNVVITT